MLSKKYIFSGKVQGVGFRYRTRNIARDFAVTGYVKNLPDGTVEMYVKGAENEVDRFLGSLEQNMKGYISEYRVEDEPLKKYSDFRIEY